MVRFDFCSRGIAPMTAKNSVLQILSERVLAKDITDSELDDGIRSVVSDDTYNEFCEAFRDEVGACAQADGMTIQDGYLKGGGSYDSNGDPAWAATWFMENYPEKFAHMVRNIED